MLGSIEAQNNLNSGNLKQSSKMVAVAREFEQMFANIMMKAMRSSIPESSLVKKSTGEKIYTDMLDSEYSRMLVGQSSMGLADNFIREMGAMDGTDVTEALLELKKGESQTRQMNIQSNMPSGMQQFASSPAPFISTDSNKFNPNIETKADSKEKLSGFSKMVTRWESLIDKAAEKFGVDKKLIAAVIQAESNGKNNAQSHVGAKGLMQLMDGTASDMGVTNSFSPMQNIMGGTKYLKNMLNRFGGDVDKALAGYNAGPGNVEKYGGVPPFKETIKYIKKITGFLK